MPDRINRQSWGIFASVDRPSNPMILSRECSLTESNHADQHPNRRTEMNANQTRRECFATEWNATKSAEIQPRQMCRRDHAGNGRAQIERGRNQDRIDHTGTGSSRDEPHSPTAPPDRISRNRSSPDEPRRESATMRRNGPEPDGARRNESPLTWY